MSRRILAGASVRCDPDLFRRHFRLLQQAADRAPAEIDYLYVLDGEDSAADAAVEAVVVEAGGEVLQAGERPPEARYSVTGTTHDWSEATFDHLAASKQRILDRAVADRYDAVFLCDTDLLIDPVTIESMMAVDRQVVSAVFWTEWDRGKPDTLGPNVWLRHPYEQTGHWKSQQEFWDRLARRRVTRVAGGGACILIDTGALERGLRYWPRLADLPSSGMWQGEDRTFAVLGDRLHVPHHADPWPDILHCYHPHQREPGLLDEAERVLTAPRKEVIGYGDLVSLSLESLEIEQLVGQVFSVRGRLGALDLLPEIEAAVFEGSIGDERLIEVRFPETWPDEELHGRRSMMRVRIVDAKEYSYSPILADRMFQMVEEN